MKKRLIGILIVMLVGTGSAVAATTAPRNTVRPTISGKAREGELLTANPGTWSGTQPLTFAYQWRRCDANGVNCSNIIGATAKTYTLTSVDVGNRLRVRVRASNDAGSATATSLASAVVSAARIRSRPPSVSVAPKLRSLCARRSLSRHIQRWTGPSKPNSVKRRCFGRRRPRRARANRAAVERPGAIV